jgi:DEAD/DEAH box helicase domain-containing protein
MSDTLVFDIETQNFFTDPGVGRDNFGALRISVVGVYSYAEDTFRCYEESEMAALAEVFRRAGRIVGFSINRYDVPVLNLYFQKLTNGKMNLWEQERIDLLEEIEAASGERVSLSRLAEANLGEAKDHHGSEAIVMYRDGRIEELKAYCLKDVELTKGLYDLFRERGYLFVPNRKTGEVVKMDFAMPARTASLF